MLGYLTCWDKVSNLISLFGGVLGKLIETTCPKCGQLSWYEQIDADIVQKCLCGLHRYAFILRDGILTKHRIPKAEVSLPERGTKIHATLMILAGAYPYPMSTKAVSKHHGHTMADTASELMVLDHRGLADKIEERRGLHGGSIWQLSALGRKRLNI